MITADARLRRARAARLTYPQVGATRTGRSPSGYERLAGQAVIGRGPDAFGTAREELLGWGIQHAAGIATSADRVVDGATVLLRIRVGPLRVTAPCRVVWVVDEPRRAGFAYGTLPGHPERGEEAFVVERRDDGAVTLTITAFSRPAAWYARLGAPVTRRVQQRFLRTYLGALRPTANT